MELLHTFFQKIPMAALFLSVAVGYWIGNFRIGNFSLGGMAGTLLVAVVIGQIGVPVDPVVKDIGRSLTNNITSLLLDPIVGEVAQQKNLDWYEVLEQEPDAGLGNGGLGRLAACFVDSMATMQIPAKALAGIGPIQDAYTITLMESDEHHEHEDHEDICTLNRLLAAAFISASKGDLK